MVTMSWIQAAGLAMGFGVEHLHDPSTRQKCAHANLYLATSMAQANYHSDSLAGIGTLTYKAVLGIDGEVARPKSSCAGLPPLPHHTVDGRASRRQDPSSSPVARLQAKAVGAPFVTAKSLPP
mmetsp:Transcript_144752/g.277852  ORF Transcript_144752/g.277852 Transcript_144752/m.277852 type:complete len:123 (+) Transcript_144752:224-592(+)